MGGVCHGASEDAGASKGLVEFDPVMLPEEEPVAVAPQFSLTVACARGLRSADWTPDAGKSDCYVEVRCNRSLLHTTKAVSDCLDPVWEEECQISGIDAGAPLELEIYDHDKDMGTSTSLGKVVLESSVYASGVNKELEVQDPRKGADAEKAYLKVKVKKGGGEYPAVASPEFAVVVTKPTADTPFGLEFDVQDKTSLYVLAVKDGPFKEYNNGKPEAERVKAGDYIVMVNGIKGNTEELLQQFRKLMCVDCWVRRGITQTIIFERPARGTLGLKFPEVLMGEFLLVLEVEELSAAATHNKSAEEAMRLLPGDRIVSVAGARGDAPDLRTALYEKTGRFQLLVERPAATDDGLSASARHLFG